MNHRYLAGLTAGTLSLMLSATPSAQAFPQVPDIFYGAINPTFTGSEHYLYLAASVDDGSGTGSFYSNNSANYFFTDTDPENLAADPQYSGHLFIGNGTFYFSYAPTFDAGNEPPAPVLGYGLVSSDSVSNFSGTGFADGNLAYTYGAVANYPDVLNFNLGDPVSGSLSFQENNPFAIPQGVPEIDADSAALPLMLMLGGLAVSERRRRRPLEEPADEE